MRQKQVDVKRHSNIENEYGEDVGELIDLISFGGTVSTIKQNELAKLGLEYGINTITVSTRFSPSISVITTNDILEIDGLQYSLIAIDNVGLRNKYLQLTARIIL